MTLPPNNEYFAHAFKSWLFKSRLYAIAERNHILRLRVQEAVFRTLPFLRIVTRAAKPIALPNEVVFNIAQCLSGGCLTRGQLIRLIQHASDPEASHRVAALLCEGAAFGEANRKRLRDEWLQNGGFWWDAGYDLARSEFDRLVPVDRSEWPEELSFEEIVDFLAFPPSPTAKWPGENADIVRDVVERLL